MPDVRVSFDDPEVFDRLSKRKEKLDLSWREVIFRGLQKEGAPDIDEEINILESAEDAVLVFDFFDSFNKRIPLRVRLQTGPNGYEVDWVVIRQGKGTEGMNQFSSEERDEIATKSETGHTANLMFEADGESYPVKAVLSWGRDKHGNCIVTSIDELEFETGDKLPA